MKNQDSVEKIDIFYRKHCAKNAILINDFWKSSHPRKLIITSTKIPTPCKTIKMIVRCIRNYHKVSVSDFLKKNFFNLRRSFRAQKNFQKMFPTKDVYFLPKNPTLNLPFGTPFDRLYEINLVSISNFLENIS